MSHEHPTLTEIALWFLGNHIFWWGEYDARHSPGMKRGWLAAKTRALIEHDRALRGEM